jgi:glycosyltransferase involved in cell wall biosynthesis
MTKNMSHAIGDDNVRVLYSFPNKLGAQRICYTAWQQVNGLAAAGAKVTVFTGGLVRAVPQEVTVHTTLAWGGVRIPYKLIGSKRAMALHDYIVSSHLKNMVGKIDIIHTWPQGALRTLAVAKKLGIPTVLERCNAHTRFAYEVVQRECEDLGVALPRGHESAFNEHVLHVEEEEFRRVDRLLCPSEFVAKTFIDRGFTPDRLARHIYGVDEKVYFPNAGPRESNPGLTMLFVGVCAVRKGVHYALEAWLQSPACQDGTFLIAGEFLPAYAKKLAPLLSHPSVHVLGHRRDVPELMRNSDIFVLPSIEEGSALVTSEARASGCVLLVSDAAGANCAHNENALVHSVGDVCALSRHITMLHENRPLLDSLRMASLSTVPEITWTAAGVSLLKVYRETIWRHHDGKDHSTSATIRPSSADDNSASTVTVVARAEHALLCETRKPLGQVTRKYVIISPVRDEAQYIGRTFESVIRQTVTPAEWIIVDDGSHDNTGPLIDEYAKQYSWIISVHRADRGRRVAGSGVMEAFYAGYERLQCDDWDFIVKLDGDVGLEPDYFERCFHQFADDPTLGICGGVMYCEENGELKLDEHPLSHVRGAMKLYIRSCWTAIGGLIKNTGWDTVDEVHAGMIGFRTRSFPDIKVIHYRPTGAAAGVWRDNFKNGHADYVSGYHPVFLAVKCFRRLFQKPYIVKALAHAYGYFSSYVKRLPRIENKELMRYVRSRQLKRLVFMKTGWE